MLVIFDTNILIDIAAGKESTIRGVREIVSNLPVFDCGLLGLIFLNIIMAGKKLKKLPLSRLNFSINLLFYLWIKKLLRFFHF